MKRTKNVVIKKGCHSRGMLSGIFLIHLRKQAENFCLKTTRQKGDPQQKPLGMTPLFNNGGFTLIELLVVVLIIGILAAVALPQYQVAVLKVRVTSLIPIMQSISNAQSVYYLANGSYADSFDKLDVELPAGGAWTGNNHIGMEYQGFICSLQGGNGLSVYCYSTASHAPKLEKYFKERNYWCWASTSDLLSNKVCKAIARREKTGTAKSMNYYIF